MSHSHPTPPIGQPDDAPRRRSWAGTPKPDPKSWLIAMIGAGFSALALGVIVSRFPSTRAFFGENGPVETLQAGLLVLVASLFVLGFMRSTGSKAVFCIAAAYACIFAVTREIPRCGSAFTGGGLCFTSGWKQTLVLTASALGVLALVLRPIDWRDATRLTNLRWIWPSFLAFGLLVAAEGLEALIYYSEIEECLELIAYIYLGAFALSILRRSYDG